MDAMKAARASRLMALKREGTREGVGRGDEAYMRSVTNDGQEGIRSGQRWCQPLVPGLSSGVIAWG